MNSFKKFLRPLKKRFGGLKYHVGIIPIASVKDIFESNLTDRILWVKGCPRNSWFADPFILKVTDDEIHILAEELEYKVRKGRISLLVVSKKNYRLLRSKILLQDSTHYSFPFIFRDGGCTYVIPENWESGEVKYYRYDPVLEELSYEKSLMKGSYVDLVFLKHDNLTHFYGTMMPYPNGRTCFIGEGGICNDIKEFSDNCARSAGDFFCYQGKTYKPNQDCNGAYGRGIVLFEMNGSAIGKEIKRIFPRKGRYAMAFHTFNVCGSYVAVDGRGYRYYWVYLLSSLLSLRDVCTRKK